MMFFLLFFLLIMSCPKNLHVFAGTHRSADSAAKPAKAALDLDQKTSASHACMRACMSLLGMYLQILLQEGPDIYVRRILPEV